MNEFELIARDGEDIEMVNAIPDKYNGHRLAGSDATMARCSFGDMLFWHYEGDGFDIWKSIYLIKRKASVIAGMERPVLELTTMYDHSFEIDWKDVVKGSLPNKQMEMYYAPYVDNVASFTSGRYETVDVHFQTELLEQYAAEFPLLQSFLNKVHGEQAARLFNSAQFINPKMDMVLREIISYSFVDALAPRYFDSYVNILLILLLERISGFHPLARTFSASDLEKAYEAKRILTTERVNDREQAYTINRLCRRLGTNPYKLKTAFKHLFGVSIGRYKKEVFMDYARLLVLENTNSLDEIAMLLGYSTQQSFTTAFRNHFGYTPGYVRKKGFQ